MTNTKKILCRADGNHTIGLGHMYRMLAITAFYKETYEIVFLTKASSTVTIIDQNLAVQTIPEQITIDQEPEWIAKHFDSEHYIIIADGYQFKSAYQKAIKSLGYTLFYIDDLSEEHMHADVVINHAPYVTTNSFKLNEDTKLALGTNYAMLRPSFNEIAKENREISKINSAFVCFGGADPHDLTFKAVKGLLQVPELKTIHVVLGGAYNHEAIQQLLVNEPRVKTYKNLSEIALIELMKTCTVAVAPSSTILYELCCVKMPVLSGYYVENQKNIYHSLVKKKAIFPGEDFRTYNEIDFKEKIQKIIENQDYNHYCIHQKQLFDGRNKQRFLGLLNQQLIHFRKAKEGDIKLVFNWSNDPLVRANSYNSDPIEFENHSKWFLAKIANQNTLFLITLINNTPAGVVRYELNDENAIVGILISEQFRGQKLASHILKESAKYYFKTKTLPILAFIKEQNIASVKSFENAGYSFYKRKDIEGINSFVYKLEKNDVI